MSYRSPPCPLQTQPSVQIKTKEEWSQRKKTQCQRPALSSMNSSSAAGNKVSYLKNYATQSPLPCIRTKEKNLTAATTWGSPFPPSPAKFPLDFYSTCWFHPSPKNTSLKVSAASELTEAHPSSAGKKEVP